MKRIILKANFMLGLQYAFGAIIPIILMPLVLKKIGIKDFGIYSIFYAWSMIGSVIVLYVFQIAAPILLSKLKNNNFKLQLINEILIAKFFLFIIWLLFVPIILYRYTLNSEQFYNAILLLILIPFSSFLNSVWFLQYRDKFMLLCKLSLVGALLSSVAVLLIRFDLLNRFTITSAFYIYPLTMGVGSYLILQKILKYDLYSSLIGLDKFLIQKSYMRLKSNFNLFFSQLIALFYGMSGAIFIGYLFNPEEAGKFSVLEKIATPLISAGLLTHTAAFPRLIQIWLSDRKKYLEILLFCIKIYLFFALIVSLVYILFSDTINLYIYGNTENKLLFSLFLIWILIGFAGPIVTSYYSMINNAYKVTQVNLITLILILCISIPLTIKLGALGWIVGLIFAHIPVLIILGKIIYTIFERRINS